MSLSDVGMFQEGPKLDNSLMLGYYQSLEAAGHTELCANEENDLNGQLSWVIFIKSACLHSIDSVYVLVGRKKQTDREIMEGEREREKERESERE